MVGAIPYIHISVRQGVIRAVYSGDADFGVTTEMLRKVARISSESQSKLLLFDIREADDRQYRIDAIGHGEQAPALGIDQTFRIAFLRSRSDQMLRYIETVTLNRDFRAKAFTDESEAVAWLKSGP